MILAVSLNIFDECMKCMKMHEMREICCCPDTGTFDLAALKWWTLVGYQPLTEYS
jgi:hypothetical protein